MLSYAEHGARTAHRPQMSKEQELGLSQNRKKFDIREEYFVRAYPFFIS